MIQLAYKKGASHAVDWIKKCLSKEQAAVLYDVLRNDSRLTEELIRLIPWRVTKYAVTGLSYITPSFVQSTVNDHEALKLARTTINEQLSKETRYYQDEYQTLEQQKDQYLNSEDCRLLDQQRDCQQRNYNEKCLQLYEVQKKYDENCKHSELQCIQQKPKPRTVKNVSDMLNILLKDYTNSHHHRHLI